MVAGLSQWDRSWNTECLKKNFVSHSWFLKLFLKKKQLVKNLDFLDKSQHNPKILLRVTEAPKGGWGWTWTWGLRNSERHWHYGEGRGYEGCTQGRVSSLPWLTIPFSEKYSLWNPELYLELQSPWNIQASHKNPPFCKTPTKSMNSYTIVS